MYICFVNSICFNIVSLNSMCFMVQKSTWIVPRGMEPADFVLPIGRFCVAAGILLKHYQVPMVPMHRGYELHALKWIMGMDFGYR